MDPIRQNEYFCPVRPDDEPIDVVYTWVNGSDPLFMESIQSLKTKKETSSRRFYGKVEDEHPGTDVSVEP